MGLWVSAGIGLAVLLALVVWLSRKGGVEAEKLHEVQIDAEAARRIAKAEANAPRTRDDVVVGLRNGSRKL